MDKRTTDAAESQDRTANDANKTVKNNWLQDKWKTRSNENSSERKGEEESRLEDSQAGRSKSQSSEPQESVLRHPTNSSASDSESKFEPKRQDSSLPPVLKPAGLINELYSLASSLVQLARGLEQFEAVLHHRSSEPSKESTTPSLSDLVKDRPDLQEILRQYLFKS